VPSGRLVPFTHSISQHCREPVLLQPCIHGELVYSAAQNCAPQAQSNRTTACPISSLGAVSCSHTLGQHVRCSAIHLTAKLHLVPRPRALPALQQMAVGAPFSPLCFFRSLGKGGHIQTSNKAFASGIQEQNRNAWKLQLTQPNTSISAAARGGRGLQVGKWAHGTWRAALAGIHGVLAVSMHRRHRTHQKDGIPLQQQRRRSAQGALLATAVGDAQCNQSRRGAPGGEVSPAPAPPALLHQCIRSSISRLPINPRSSGSDQANCFQEDFVPAAQLATQKCRINCKPSKTLGKPKINTAKEKHFPLESHGQVKSVSSGLVPRRQLRFIYSATHINVSLWLRGSLGAAFQPGRTRAPFSHSAPISEQQSRAQAAPASGKLNWWLLSWGCHLSSLLPTSLLPC